MLKAEFCWSDRKLGYRYCLIIVTNRVRFHIGWESHYRCVSTMPLLTLVHQLCPVEPSNLQQWSHPPNKSTLLSGDAFCFQGVDALQPSEVPILLWQLLLVITDCKPHRSYTGADQVFTHTLPAELCDSLVCQARQVIAQASSCFDVGFSDSSRAQLYSLGCRTRLRAFMYGADFEERFWMRVRLWHKHQRVCSIAGMYLQVFASIWEIDDASYE